VLEDQQLVGRIWRHPQVKPVQIYRLIGANTSDVFLNNISFDKGAIMAAFAMSSEKISKYIYIIFSLLYTLVNI